MNREREYSPSVWCCCWLSAECPGVGVPGVVIGTTELCLACAKRLGEAVPEKPEAAVTASAVDPGATCDAVRGSK